MSSNFTITNQCQKYSKFMANTITDKTKVVATFFPSGEMWGVVKKIDGSASVCQLQKNDFYSLCQDNRLKSFHKFESLHDSDSFGKLCPWYDFVYKLRDRNTTKDILPNQATLVPENVFFEIFSQFPKEPKLEDKSLGQFSTLINRHLNKSFSLPKNEVEETKPVAKQIEEGVFDKKKNELLQLKCSGKITNDTRLIVTYFENKMFGVVKRNGRQGELAQLTKLNMDNEIPISCAVTIGTAVNTQQTPYCYRFHEIAYVPYEEFKKIFPRFPEKPTLTYQCFGDFDCAVQIYKKQLSKEPDVQKAEEEKPFSCWTFLCSLIFGPEKEKAE